MRITAWTKAQLELVIARYRDNQQEVFIDSINWKINYQRKPLIKMIIVIEITIVKGKMWNRTITYKVIIRMQDVEGMDDENISMFMRKIMEDKEKYHERKFVFEK